jgi:hypothetical protein
MTGFESSFLENIFTAIPLIPDWNIFTLRKSVNQNFQRERVKEVGCLLNCKSAV